MCEGAYMDNILEIQNLKKRYKNSQFELNINHFEIPRGFIMGFVGENGSGKTTTIRCILNLLKRDSGTIKVFGRELTDKDKKMREDIGVVFDSSVFSKELSVNKISKIMQYTYINWDNDKYYGLIERFGLSPDNKISTYSKGMLMKLSIAAALSHTPKLLLLDEATSGLDPVVRDDILDVLLSFVQQEENSILLSSHITSDLEKIADYITFIDKGGIVLTDKNDDILRKYGVIRCSEEVFRSIDLSDAIAWRRKGYQVDILVPDINIARQKYKELIIDHTNIEEVMLMFAKGERDERCLS